MPLIEKFGNFKERMDEIEKQTTQFKHDTEHKLNKLREGIELIQELNARLERVETSLKARVADDTKHIGEVESIVNKKISRFISDSENFQKWFKESELKHYSLDKKLDDASKDIKNEIVELKNKIKDAEDRMSKSEKKYDTSLSKLSAEAQQSRKLETDIDKIVEDNLKDIRGEFDEIKKRMMGLVGLEKLHQHFAELKMDVTTTDAGLRQIIHDLKQKVDTIKDDMDAYPKLNELVEQDKDLFAKIKLLEEKTNTDFNVILKEIEKLGEIFSSKHEADMRFNELRSNMDRMQQTITNIDKKHTMLEKDVLTREGYTEQSVQATVTQLQSQVQNLARRFEPTEQLQEELEILREQLIMTQNALVELNSFLHGQRGY
jgi:chromosome segregation ATPase